MEQRVIRESLVSGGDKERAQKPNDVMWLLHGISHDSFVFQCIRFSSQIFVYCFLRENLYVLLHGELI